MAELRENFMWHRCRVTPIARTRRALFVPVTAREVSLVGAEPLEDRTLLSAVSGIEASAGFVGDDSEVQPAQVWLIQANSLGWFFGLPAHVERRLAAASEERTSAGGDVVLQLTFAPSWLGQPNTAGEVAGPANLDAPVLVVVHAASVGPFGLGFEAATDAVAEPVIVTFHTAENPADSLGVLLNRLCSETSYFLKLALPTTRPLDELRLPHGSIVDAISIATNPVTTALLDSRGLSAPDFTATPIEGTEVFSVAPRSEAILGVTRLLGLPGPGNLIDLSVTEIKQDFIETRTETAAAPEPPSTLLAVSTSATVDSAEAAVALALLQTSKLVEAAGIDVLVESPAESLRMAAMPIVAAVETVLTTLDTFAGAFFALFVGSGGDRLGPIAPTVQPKRVALPILIDSQRPRWALQTGQIEELAAYSLVVAPDQHFDLRDFGPASRLSAGDSAIRIEFDLSPQHGIVQRGDVAGVFRYSADPGFSGVDGARFQVTFASGQTVAGNVTFVVPDRGSSERSATVIRQVELPVDEARDFEASPDSIDASFRLSGVWLDLP